MRSKHPTSSYYAVTAGLTRKGKVVKQGDEVLIEAKSLRRAKRFMRTGKENRYE